MIFRISLSVCLKNLCGAGSQSQGLLGLMDVVLDVIDGGEESQVVSLWTFFTLKQLFLHKMPVDTKIIHTYCTSKTTAPECDTGVRVPGL